ncbi:putative receptor-like protein kinase At3g47110 [Durio zibethinus]|uniref:non-specific serine/threonine protein kinase n=1 Tax=Durio zibethinus TaxID=66656 RepID=A0A6P6AJI5_DURZI|nr:putative receptor-like protein kinase At3g47110 [Durio zibethinus]
MGNLKNLLVFNAPANDLGSGKAGDFDFLSSLSNCSRLQHLGIEFNRFGGVIPNSIANLSTSLRILTLGGNQIAGSIPEGVGNLVNLNRMDMRENFLVGEIPISIGNLQNLEGLNLISNHLTGKIPSSIGNLSRLTELYLSNNKFEGAIPLSLRDCKNMQKLHLSYNKLNGSIPNQLFGAFESLAYLTFSHNSFTGLLPSDLSNLKNLVELYVDNNNFFGEIPKNLGESSELTILFMEKNSFQGNIPQSFASLRSLEYLDLSNNNLSGTIPPELQKLPFLVSLNISFNHLEGEVPKGGVFKNVSGFSFSGNEKLCGGIPEIELPKCFGKVLSTKVIIAVIFSILLGSILAVLLVYLSWRRKCGNALTHVALFDDGFLRLSYKELLQATQGFASSNLVGSGSFGSVYKGVLHQQEKPVAVKVFDLQNRGAARSFMAECKALRKVRHRNLLKIITCCSSIDYQGNDFKALVFEFMPNGSLENWLHEQHESRYLNLAQRLDIAIDVANAIDYLHHDSKTLIVHCDLKPTNVLLDDDMIAHVSDFGLAKLLSSDTGNLGTDQTSSSMINGTIGYVPPEYGMSGAVTPEGDIYSYGILLLEMITGRRPTDDFFQDGLSLHHFCKKALPEGLKEILDFRLLEEIDQYRQRIRSQPNLEEQILECLVSFTKVGVACSAEVPGDRMSIKDAIIELHATKARLLRTGVYTRDRG